MMMMNPINGLVPAGNGEEELQPGIVESQEDESSERTESSDDNGDTEDEEESSDDDDDDVEDEDDEEEEGMEDQQQQAQPIHQLQQQQQQQPNQEDLEHIRQQLQNAISWYMSGAGPRNEDDFIRMLPTMLITSQERNWGLAVKQAVEAEDTLAKLTDLEYAQYGIVTRGNVEESLHKIRGLQLFREEYGINNTLGQAAEMLQAFLEQSPGMLLSVDKARTSSHPNDHDPIIADLHSHYLMAFDFAKIFSSAVHLERNKRNMLGALYYAHHAAQPTINSIRDGILFIAECEGMTWDNVCMDVVGPIWREMKLYYPINLKEISLLRAATAATVMFNLSKAFLPKRVSDRVNLGCEFQAFSGRLDELFLTKPTREENDQHILKRAVHHLQERFRNEQLFRL